MEGLQCLIFGLAFMLCSCKERVKFTNCGKHSAGAGAKLLEITPCKAHEFICPLIKGSAATIKLTFTTAEEVTAIKPVVIGYIGIIPSTFYLDNEDGCKDSGVECPVKKGATVTYIATVPVKKWWPSILVTTKFELQDKQGKTIACVKMPMQIRSP